jgi:putative endopeptidase
MNFSKFLNLKAIVLLLVILVACKPENKLEDPKNDALYSHIDTSINPADDFFLYANGKWFKENPIPASEQQNGLWQVIQDTINAQVLAICKNSALSTNEKKGSAKQKIGDFYYSGMDSTNLNTKGISDIKADFDKIDAINDLNSLISTAAYLHQVSSAPFFNFYVGQDDKISTKHAIIIGQGGLSLPDRSYYIDSDNRSISNREKFVKHLANMYMLLSYPSDKANMAANKFLQLETAIAKISRKSEDTRDPLKNYNKITFQELTKLCPNVNWNLFFTNVGLKNIDSVIVGQPEFLSSLHKLLKSVPMEDWKNYLKYHHFKNLAAYLDDKTFNESFSFYSTTLRGVPEAKPRWKRVVNQTNGTLGELIGQVYVNEYLPKGTKDKLHEIGNSIKTVYAERINSLDWMSQETKTKALKKLDAIVMKVGYPDKWKDLSSLEVDRNSYVKNAMNGSKWAFDYMIAKYGKAVDRSEWNMYPQTYNAYYNPSNNEIVVPGCNIIVPGYERKLADDAILYSIIGGSTFGHEITHGFDDQGSKYDEFGNLNNWWTSEDSSKFYAKTRKIVQQFNEFIAVDSLHVNGELTQGENIADLGGVVMGYEAFKKTSQYKNKEVIAGLDPDKRFFLGYALAWMINERPEALALQVKSNVHSPAKFRVIGPLANIPEFHKTFNIKNGDKMFRPDSTRVIIW